MHSLQHFPLVCSIIASSLLDIHGEEIEDPRGPGAPLPDVVFSLIQAYAYVKTVLLESFLTTKSVSYEPSFSQATNGIGVSNLPRTAPGRNYYCWQAGCHPYYAGAEEPIVALLLSWLSHRTVVYFMLANRSLFSLFPHRHSR
jgi:hypothetical protein